MADRNDAAWEAEGQALPPEIDEEVDLVVTALRRLRNRVTSPVIKACLDAARADIVHLALETLDEDTAIRQANEKDFSEVGRLLDVLRHPFDEQPGNEAYAALPPSWASSLEVSCSS